MHQWPTKGWVVDTNWRPLLKTIQSPHAYTTYRWLLFLVTTAEKGKFEK